MFFELSTFGVGALLVVVIGGAAVLGTVIGLRRHGRPGADHQPIGVVQGVMLGLVGLLLAFGLTMSVGRYDDRRALVVQEANDIGTTYLRAQLLPEPIRTQSMDALRDYADASIDMADQVPESDGFDEDAARKTELQRTLWGLAGDAVRDDPNGSVPRVYIESLNAMIDTHTSRLSSLSNRVPTPVLALQVLGSAVAIGALAMYLAMLGRSVLTTVIAASVVIMITFVSIDLDRPHRGFIKVPDKALVSARASMDAPPAAEGP